MRRREQHFGHVGEGLDQSHLELPQPNVEVTFCIVILMAPSPTINTVLFFFFVGNILINSF